MKTPPRKSVAELEEKEENPPILQALSPAWFLNAFHAFFLRRPSKEEAKQRVNILTLFSYSTTKEKWLMGLGVFCATIAGLSLPAWLVLVAKALDKFNDLATLLAAGIDVMDILLQELAKLGIAFLVVGGISMIMGAMYVSIWTQTGEAQAVRIRELYVRSVLRQDATWFDTHDRQGLPTTISTSMVHIKKGLGRRLVDTYALLVSGIGCLIVALLLNTSLALVMLCAVPVVILFILVFGCLTRGIQQKAADEQTKAGTLATEVIFGIKTVASLCAQSWALSRYDQMVRSSRKFSIRSGFLNGLLLGITGACFYITYTFAFMYGTQQVQDRQQPSTILMCLWDKITGNEQEAICGISGASVLCCVYGVILFVTYFGLAGPGLADINMARHAASDIYTTINRVPEIDPDKGTTLDGDTLKGQIEWSNVFFAYPTRPKSPIFTNFSLTIKPGQSLALVGPSGSGKSSVARLLLRFYDCVGGSIRIDNVPLTELCPAWWRDQVGYVSQEPILLPGTIESNISCGKPGGATKDEVIAAAKAACAHDFIMDLPDGYDTFYSGSGLALSGGQMQRISIARAIIKNPTLLLLDEATSALDSNSEKTVIAAIANIRKTRTMTMISVAHRLTTILGSDQIAVIANGSIAEVGSHRELMAQDGIYSALCTSQGITADTKGLDEATAGPEISTILKQPGPEVEVDLEVGKGVEKPKESNETQVTEIVPEEVDEAQEKLAPFSQVWKHSASDSLYLFLGLLGSVIVGALSPAESILTAKIVETFYNPDVSRDEIVATNSKYILPFFWYALASLVGNTMIGCGLSVTGERLSTRMRLLGFNTIIRRHMGWFDTPDHSTGELTTRLGADAEAVSGITGMQLGYQLRVYSSLITGVVIALAFSWKIGLLAIACVPLIMLPSLVQWWCMKTTLIQDGSLSPATILETGLRGIVTVQGYNLQSKFGDDFAEALKPEMNGITKIARVSGFVYGFSQFSIFVAFAVVFYFGAVLMTQLEIDFVQWFTPVLSVMFGALGASQVGADFEASKKARAAAARIFALEEEPFDGTDPFAESKGDQPGQLDGLISFLSVHFHYPTRPEQPIYYKTDDHDGLELNIAAKESVAFVGKSGSGKSTGLSLVMRFYEATKGRVEVDGHEIKDLDLQWLRKQIGYVGQMPVLFSGTVRSNLLLGKPDATEEEIIAAAKAANAHDFVSALTDGYDTDIGSSGSLLSGGQRQRIAIARAIISNPSLLVLDEATAALDNESEKVVQAALDELQKTQPRTTMTVAHRLSTIRNCDRIAVLGHGGVEEIGSHSSLVQQQGLYYQLCKLQGAVDSEPDQARQSYARFKLNDKVELQGHVASRETST